jgi:CDP-diacylglycerol pyrophosphatase
MQRLLAARPLLIAAWLFPVGARAADPSALWNIVSGKCVPHEQAAHDPAPCADVNITDGVNKGYAVLKDIVGASQFLLIPTERLSGIEDPAVLADGATNYWEAAWQARSYAEDRLHASLPRDGIALAINSADGRTQNQFHIHIDCIRPDVRAALAADLDKIGTTWAPFPTALAGHDYRAIRITQDTLKGVNPFRVLKDSNPAMNMAMQTLALVGETFPDGSNGFVLLDDHVDLPAGDRASAEELEDHSCAIVRK